MTANEALALLSEVADPDSEWEQKTAEALSVLRAALLERDEALSIIDEIMSEFFPVEPRPDTDEDPEEAAKRDDAIIKRAWAIISAPRGPSVVDALKAEVKDLMTRLVAEVKTSKEAEAEVERLKKVEADFAQAIKESGHYREQKARAEKAEAEVERLKKSIGFHDVDEFYPVDKEPGK